MSDNNDNKILNIPQKPHKTVLNNSAIDLDLKGKSRTTTNAGVSPNSVNAGIDDENKAEISAQDILDFQNKDLTSLEAKTYIKENSKYYGSKVMKSILSPLIRCKYTGFIILVILFILDKLSLENEVRINIDDQWGIMSVIGLTGIVIIVILAHIFAKVKYKG